MMVVMKNVSLRHVIILGFNIKNIIYYSLTCDGTGDKDCLTCNTSAHRYYHSHHGDKCLCFSGYFDDGSNEEC